MQDSSNLPLVIMLDFLNEVSVEEKVLQGIARVVTLNMQNHSDPIPEIAK